MIKYLFLQDKILFFKIFFKNPFKYFFNFIFPFKKKIAVQNGIFLFNIKNLNECKKIIKNKNIFTLFGFSYCQKPDNCPQKKFSKNCIKEKNIPKECSSCMLSKFFLKNNKIKNTDFFIITTASSLGEKILEISKKRKISKTVLVITCCFFSINIFKKIANILNIKAVAIPFQKNSCLDFKTFLQAEKGIKKEKTFLSKQNEIFIQEMVKERKNIFASLPKIFS